MNEKAIVVYIDNSKRIFEEFSWLYKTWILWELYQEYDIVAYINPKATKELSEWVPEHPNLLLRPLTPINEENEFWEGYKFANSFFMFNDKSEEEFIKGYKYILKTDCDVFLTKYLKGLFPEKVMVGWGGYMEGNNKQEILSNIKRIQKKLNAKDEGLNHVGASIFGKTEVLVKIIQEHFNVTKYILKTEWNETEGKWPGWFKGVSSMYAIHICVNHFLNSRFINLYSLDSLCLNNKIDSNTYHIHAWHTQDDFSKHKYFRGEYDNEKYESIPLIAKDYCKCIATNKIEDLLKIENNQNNEN
jgi:hypothetical protein